MITEASENKLLLDNELTIVDFWASWCGPCKMQLPILEKLSNNVKIVKVNIDDNPFIAQQNLIQSVPTLIVFKNKIEVERFVGVQTEDFIKDKISRYV